MYKKSLIYMYYQNIPTEVYIIYDKCSSVNFVQEGSFNEIEQKLRLYYKFFCACRPICLSASDGWVWPHDDSSNQSAEIRQSTGEKINQLVDLLRTVGIINFDLSKHMKIFINVMFRGNREVGHVFSKVTGCLVQFQ